MLVNASLVPPPPIDIHVCNPEALFFSAVNRLYILAEFSSIGEIWNEDGSKCAKAKLRWVKPDRLRSSGVTYISFSKAKEKEGGGGDLPLDSVV